METVINQPKFQGIWDPVEYVEKALQYVPPPKEKKEPKPAAPKVEKPAKKVEEKEEEDGDEALVAPPPVKNPLDDLPKSPFNLEDWKRAYSNMDTRGSGGAIEWFYERYGDTLRVKKIIG
jgi:elongation factor 1-gamma